MEKLQGSTSGYIAISRLWSIGSHIRNHYELPLEQGKFGDGLLDEVRRKEVCRLALAYAYKLCRKVMKTKYIVLILIVHLYA